VTRIGLTPLSRFFNWRDALVVVRPETLIRWHRAGWKLFWRLKSHPGRPPIPTEIRALIRGIANELQLKLGIQVSPRTVNKYLRRRPRGRPKGDLRWSTFLRLHAQEIIACDFFVAITTTFRLLYVFVVIEHRSRRLINCNITAHPSSAWTLHGAEDEKVIALAAHRRQRLWAVGVCRCKNKLRCRVDSLPCHRALKPRRRCSQAPGRLPSSITCDDDSGKRNTSFRRDVGGAETARPWSGS
jgi:hypothetical protein